MKRPTAPILERSGTLAAAAALLLVVGCAAQQRADDGLRTDRGQAGREIDRFSAAERSRQLLLGSEVGLEVREWIIEADSATIASVIAGFRVDRGDDADPVVDEDLAERLRLNGLRAVPVRVDDLPAIEASLGFATLNRRGWYGQLAQWMSLHGQMAGGPEQALFIDGRPRRFDRGEYRLMGRAWVLPMEDGPRLNLQIVPEYQPPQRESLRHLLARPTHDGTRRGEPISSITLDLLIKPGYALILTGEEPSVKWERDETDSPDSGRDYLGPHVELPPTFGEMLFKLGGVRGGRGMLIFVPRVPDEHHARATAGELERR